MMKKPGNWTASVVIAVACVLLIAYIFPRVGGFRLLLPGLKSGLALRIESEGKWIARYLPTNATPSDLSGVIDELLHDGRVSIDKRAWVIADALKPFAPYADPLFADTNAVNGRVLVVKQDRSIGWVSADSIRIRLGN